jgi:acyl-CoA thioesterase-1
MYRKIAQETKSPLVPFMLEGVAEKPALFQADRLHPTAAAQPLILNNIWPHLAALMKK